MFSGSGSFGLECMSRGAKKVSFVESDVNASKILRDNFANYYVNKKIMSPDCTNKI